MIARGFARIFFKNSINFEAGVIRNNTKKEEYKFKPLPEFMQKLLESGGLIPYIKKQKW